MKKLLFDKNSILGQIKDRYSMAIIIKLIKNSARAETGNSNFWILKWEG